LGSLFGQPKKVVQIPGSLHPFEPFAGCGAVN
jgi:hypothetical protein